MKIAINNNGLEVEVSDDAVVKTIDGVHYLLTSLEEVEIAAREIEWQADAAQRANELATINRRNSYIHESDPIFFKYQRNEATKQEWLDKIAEIRLRYPKT